VTEGGITTATDLGTFAYKPGIAQSLASLTTAMADPVSGLITLTASGLTNQATALNPQISFQQSLAATEQRSLQQEFSQLEVTLGSLKNQGSALASALSGLS
jgi:flagellar hook-associated protein 2